MSIIKITLPAGVSKKATLRAVAEVNGYKAKVLSDRKTIIKNTIEEVNAFAQSIPRFFETYAPREDGKYDVFYTEMIDNIPKDQFGLNIVASVVKNLFIQAHEKDIAKKVQDFQESEKKKIQDTIPIKDISIEFFVLMKNYVV